MTSFATGLSPKTSHLPAKPQEPRALFIGYEKDMADGLAELATEKGFASTLACSLESALELLEESKQNKTPYDLVIFDEGLPVSRAQADAYDRAHEQKRRIQKENLKNLRATDTAEHVLKTNAETSPYNDIMRECIDLEGGAKFLEECAAGGLLNGTTHVRCLNSYDFAPAKLHEAARNLGNGWQGITNLPVIPEEIEQQVLEPVLKALKAPSRA